jgi:hypothetical protein
VNWSAIPTKGYLYKDPNAAHSGIRKMLLKGGGENQAKVLVKGKGSALLPNAPLAALSLPVTAQLVNSDTSVCFEATYESADVLKNDPDHFKAKAQ